MNTNIIHEYQSLRVIGAIARVYHTSSSQSRQIARDLRHVIAAYNLCDHETALACNRYITAKYPVIYKVASRYGLRPMNCIEMLQQSTTELKHMLYNLSIFLYDRLHVQATTAIIEQASLSAEGSGHKDVQSTAEAKI